MLKASVSSEKKGEQPEDGAGGDGEPSLVGGESAQQKEMPGGSWRSLVLSVAKSIIVN